jgi:hypothetical protein
MGILDTIENIRVLLLSLLILGIFISFSIFIIGIDFTDSENANENLKSVFEKGTNAIIPTEVTWLQIASSNVTNPYILLILIIGIFWFFGYFKK